MIHSGFNILTVHCINVQNWCNIELILDAIYLSLKIRCFQCNFIFAYLITQFYTKFFLVTKKGRALFR